MRNYNLLKLIDNKDLFKELFYARSEEIGIIENEVKELLKEEDFDIEKEYDVLIKNIKENKGIDKELKEAFITGFNNYLEKELYKNSLMNEKYYIEGLRDGINLIISSIISNKEINLKNIGGYLVDNNESDKILLDILGKEKFNKLIKYTRKRVIEEFGFKSLKIIKNLVYVNTSAVLVIGLAKFRKLNKKEMLKHLEIDTMESDKCFVEQDIDKFAEEFKEYIDIIEEYMIKRKIK